MAATMNFSPFRDPLFVSYCVICGVCVPWLLEDADPKEMLLTYVAGFLDTLSTQE